MKAEAGMPTTDVQSDAVELLTLFVIFYKIGAFTIGGGYAMLPLIRAEIVERKGWVKDDQFLDILAIAQSSPGAIAVNTAIVVGHRLRGLPGMLVAVLGAVLPSFLIILVIANFFLLFRQNAYVQSAFAAIRPAVAGLIAAAIVKIGRPMLKQRLNVILYLLLVTAGFLLGLHPIVLIVLGGVAGLFFYGGEAS